MQLDKNETEKTATLLGFLIEAKKYFNNDKNRSNIDWVKMGMKKVKEYVKIILETVNLVAKLAGGIDVK